MNVTLNDVKAALNITGDYQDAALTEWMNEVKDFIAERASLKGGAYALFYASYRYFLKENKRYIYF